MSLPVATLCCRAQMGLEAPLVQVEVTVASGLPAFHLVGLPATVVRESRDRVHAAMLSCGFEYPAGRIVVNLAPAEIPKEGGRFELPIALGILIASGQLTREPGRAALCEFYGELGLGGELKSVRGILLAAAHASRDGHELLVPAGNADEALIAATTAVRAASHLKEVCRHLTGEEPLRLHACERRTPSPTPALGAEPDLSDVRGQFQAKRALLIAAAGSHSLLIPYTLDPFTRSEDSAMKRFTPLIVAVLFLAAVQCACAYFVIRAVASVEYDTSTAALDLERMDARAAGTEP